jgi:inosine-uridine nucleoside N-ribohydrolase
MGDWKVCNSTLLSSVPQVRDHLGVMENQRGKVCYPTRVPRAFLIDTDTASDDAVALIMALRAPDVRVVAITTVAGNVDVQQATRNALYTVELCGADAPVYVGAEKPLLREYQNATWLHGRDGLGDHN